MLQGEEAASVQVGAAAVAVGVSREVEAGRREEEEVPEGALLVGVDNWSYHSLHCTCLM